MRVFMRAVIATLYTVIYGLCALVTAGAGHGIVLFCLPLLTWIFYLVGDFHLSEYLPDTGILPELIYPSSTAGRVSHTPGQFGV
jgi:hypothetical protein